MRGSFFVAGVQQHTSVGTSTHDYAFATLGGMPATSSTGEEMALRALCHQLVDALPVDELREIFADSIEDAKLSSRTSAPREQPPMKLFRMSLGVEKAPAFTLDEL